MTVLNPRSRSISIRLSEEEYSALRRLCFMTGARSISDFTREAMRVILKGANREEAFGIHMDAFRAQIENLDSKIEQLKAQIATSKAESGQ